MKILVAVDGSDYTKHMLAYLAAHEEWLGPSQSYEVLTVVPAVPPRAAALLDRSLLKQYYEDEAEKVFKAIRTFLSRQGLTAEYRSKVGHAAEQIAKRAAEGRFDLLMMGTHGHGNLANLVMGSVATRVLAACEVPVLLVR